MKGKRLLILGAAFALGLSACAQAVTIARNNPLKAVGDEHTFTDVAFSQLLNNNAAIDDVNIAEQSYTVSKIVANVKYNKTVGGVTITPTIGTTVLAAQTMNESATVDLTWNVDPAVKGAINFDFVNNCGSGTGKGTFYFNSVTLTEGLSSSTQGTLTNLYIAEEDDVQKQYVAGDSFNPEGLVVQAQWDGVWDVETNVVSLLTWSPDPLTAGTTDVIGIYSGKSVVVHGLTVSPRPGSDSTPYTVPQARNAIDTNGDKTDVYAMGVVSQIVTAYSTQYGNVSYDFSEDGSTSSSQLRAYRGVGGTVSITGDSDVVVGDKVVVRGNLTKYGSTYEFEANNKLEARDHIQSVSVQTAPNKTTYNAGEVFSPTGLVLRVFWKDTDYLDYAYAQYSSLISFSTDVLTSNDSGDFAISIFGKTANQAIVVNNVQAVTSVSVEPASVALEEGKTQQLATTVVVESGAPQTVNYSSSNTSVATVNASGLVTAVSKGVASITATSTFDNTKSDSCIVVVIDPVDESSTANNAVMKYSGSTTGNMTETGNAANVGLDAVIFSVDAGKGETTNMPGLNKAGDMRLYSLKSAEATGHGSFFTVSTSNNYQIQYIEIDFAENAQDAVVYAGSNVTNGVEGIYSINSTSFKVENGYVSNGGANEQVHINKITIHYIALGGSSITPNDYLDSATSFAKIDAQENWIDQNEVTVEKTINELAETNEWTISSGSNVTCYPSIILDGNVTVSTTGSANCGSVWGSTTKEWRLYQAKGGNVIVSAAKGYKLVSVTLTFGISNTGALMFGDDQVVSDSEVALSGNSATFVVGNSESATNGQIKITGIAVTYKKLSLQSVSNVSLEFGATISKSSWGAIEGNSDWSINEFGIMLFKTRQASVPTVEEVFNATPAKTIAINNTQYGVTLDEDGDNYSFSVKVNISSEANYDIYFCAAPYVVVDGDYYFLDNMKYSVQSLASYYLNHSGSGLSADALNVLAGN